MGFRADLVASGFMMDSSGRVRSNAPCLKCDLYRRVLDPNLMMNLKCINASMHLLRDKMRSLYSSCMCLEKGHYLRLLPALLWIQQDPVNRKDLLYGSTESNPEDFEDAMAILNRFIRLLPSSIPVTMYPETESITEYETGIFSFKPFNSSNTIGKVDIVNNTLLKGETALGIDMRHEFHNISELLLLELFVNIASKPEDLELCRVLNEARRNVGLQFQDQSVCYIGVNRMVREKAKKRYGLLCQFISDFKWVEGLVNGNDTLTGRKAEEKIVFCNSILPYLVQDSMEDPKVYAITHILAIMGVMYNYDGPIEGIHAYNLLLQSMLTILEMLTIPSFSTVCIHYLLHIPRCYAACGPLKGWCTLHCEQQYNGLREQATGGNKPVLTMSTRQNTSKMCQLIGNSVRDIESSPRYIGKECDSVGILREEVCFLLERTIINYNDDVRREGSDWHPVVGFLDRELCGGIEIRTCEQLHRGDTGLGTPSPGEKWATTNVDINSYFIQHRYAGQEAEWVGMGVWSSISWDGRIVESLDCPLSDLTAATFRKNAFGIPYSVNRQIHLFQIRRFASFNKGKEIFIQALVCEIPIQRVFALLDYPFAFSIDLSSLSRVTPSFTLISMHRLHIHHLFC